ncbi:hypothetical protein NL676_015014 [Syzygium grande]|nr:hypothetical protein NL676_015014 [Syzygium grande]
MEWGVGGSELLPSSDDDDLKEKEVGRGGCRGVPFRATSCHVEISRFLEEKKSRARHSSVAKGTGHCSRAR